MAQILVIDDDGDLRGTVADWLSLAGYDVAEARNGETGLAEILRLRPDLVLCDIGMPGLTGDQLLLQVRAEAPALSRMPFLFLTGRADRDSIVAGHRLGADDYLTKPVDLELLTARVAQRLDQTRRWEETFADEHARLRQQLLNHLADGLILLDRAGRVLSVNAAAGRILAQRDGLDLRNGELVAERAQLGPRLGRLIAATPRLHHLSVPRPSLRPAFLLRCCRLDDADAALALFLVDPTLPRRPSEAALADLFDFTATEARIAADLATGQSVDDIAGALKVSRNTVHFHLRALFRKSDTARQGELVARLMAAAAVVAGQGAAG